MRIYDYTHNGFGKILKEHLAYSISEKYREIDEPNIEANRLMFSSLEIEDLLEEGRRRVKRWRCATKLEVYFMDEYRNQIRIAVIEGRGNGRMSSERMALNVFKQLANLEAFFDDDDEMVS